MIKPTYTITLEALPQAVPEIVRLRHLLKTSLRSFGFRCVAVQSPGSGADQTFDTAIKLASLIFPAGVVFTCAWCNRTDAAGITETARAMSGAWPRCHGVRMAIRSDEAEILADTLASRLR
jgi:hypothetical protein